MIERNRKVIFFSSILLSFGLTMENYFHISNIYQNKMMMILIKQMQTKVHG